MEPAELLARIEEDRAVAAARAEVAALDTALGRLRAEPHSRKAVAELIALAQRLPEGAGARSFPHIAGSARAAAAALSRSARLPLDGPTVQAVELLRHHLEAALAVARFEAGARIGAIWRSGPAAASVSPIRQRLLVAVLGDGLDSPDSCRAGWQAGAALATAGVNLLCGGMGGVMQAAARGFREAGAEGLVVGLLPGGERHEANAWVDLPLPTGVDQAQCALVAEAADGAVAIGGGGGTLGEIGLLLRHKKPVAVVRGSGGVAESMAGFRIGQTRILDAGDPEEAVRLVLRALAGSLPHEPAGAHGPGDTCEVDAHPGAEAAAPAME